MWSAAIDSGVGPHQTAARTEAWGTDSSIDIADGVPATTQPQVMSIVGIYPTEPIPIDLMGKRKRLQP